MAIQDHQFRRLDKSKQASSILVRAITYILSTLGLLMSVIGYSIVGGFVFQWLEAENEKTVSDKMPMKRYLLYVLPSVSSLRWRTTNNMDQIRKSSLSEIR